MCLSNLSDTASNAPITTVTTVTFFSFNSFLISSLRGWYYYYYYYYYYNHQARDDKKAPVRIILPFKDQRSVNSVRRQLGELSRKIGKDIHPVYTTRKIGPSIKQKESKPPFAIQQCVVYHFECDMPTPVST